MERKKKTENRRPNDWACGVPRQSIPKKKTKQGLQLQQKQIKSIAKNQTGKELDNGTSAKKEKTQPNLDSSRTKILSSSCKTMLPSAGTHSLSPCYPYKTFKIKTKTSLPLQQTTAAPPRFQILPCALAPTKTYTLNSTMTPGKSYPQFQNQTMKITSMRISTQSIIKTMTPTQMITKPKQKQWKKMMKKKMDLRPGRE